MANIQTPNFDKAALLPVIVQDANTHIVLMLGYMNKAAYEKTLTENIVTFFSRSKNRLWTKGETSKNYLHVQQILIDCDADTILIKAIPDGPTCHTGDDTCFKEVNEATSFIHSLEKTIEQRIASKDEASYTNSLLAKGINKVAQKVGEEAVELVIEAKDNNEALFLGEAADLIYHYIVLLKAKGYQLSDVEAVLKARHKK
jgi:phosphoribosyl-AMP cyclohydrolase / phosphoribosyl-ATP pyrophosphohydrolase